MSDEKVVEVIEAIEMVERGGRETVIVEEIVVVESSKPHEEVELTAELLHEYDSHRKHFHISRKATLLEVLDKAAKKLDAKLLPNHEQPLDLLRGVYQQHEIGPALNLEVTLAEFLKQEPHTHDFAVELVLAIQINTRWRVAPHKEMTPRAILELAGLSPTEYSLYFPCDSVDPLPPDTPIELCRGQRFEAQRDGKYGQGERQ